MQLDNLERAVVETSCRYRESIFALVRTRTDSVEWPKVCEAKFAAERDWDNAVDALLAASSETTTDE